MYVCTTSDKLTKSDNFGLEALCCFTGVISNGFTQLSVKTLRFALHVPCLLILAMKLHVVYIHVMSLSVKQLSSSGTASATMEDELSWFDKDLDDFDVPISGETAEEEEEEEDNGQELAIIVVFNHEVLCCHGFRGGHSVFNIW